MTSVKVPSVVLGVGCESRSKGYRENKNDLDHYLDHLDPDLPL